MYLYFIIIIDLIFNSTLLLLSLLLLYAILILYYDILYYELIFLKKGHIANKLGFYIIWTIIVPDPYSVK